MVLHNYIIVGGIYGNKSISSPPALLLMLEAVPDPPPYHLYSFGWKIYMTVIHYSCNAVEFSWML